MSDQSYSNNRNIGFGVSNEIPSDNSLLGQGYDYYSFNPKSNTICDVGKKNIRIESDSELGGKSFYEVKVLKTSTELANYYGFKGRLDAKYGPYKGSFKAKHVSSIRSETFTINIIARAISILNKEFLEPKKLDTKFLNLLRKDDKSLLISYGTHFVNQRVNGGELNFIFSLKYSNLNDYLYDYKKLKLKYDSGFSQGGSLSLSKVAEISKDAQKSELSILFFKNGSPIIKVVNQDNFLQLIEDFTTEISPEGTGPMNNEKNGRYTTLALGVEELSELPELNFKQKEKFINWITAYRKKLVKVHILNQKLLERISDLEVILNNVFEYNFEDNQLRDLKEKFDLMEQRIQFLAIDYDSLLMNPFTKIDLNPDEFKPIGFKVPNKKDDKGIAIPQIPPNPKTEWLEKLNGIRGGIHETYLTELKFGKRYILEISGRVRRRDHKGYYPYYKWKDVGEFIIVKFKDQNNNWSDPIPFEYSINKPFVIENFPYKAKISVFLNCEIVRNHPKEHKLKAKLIQVN